ncbi:YggT family protein [Legionella rubrilucens]|uniref:YggT family protein n=1 Tax=Legionella rubrilucens TaxID=458 RepID=A0A0W0XVM0_9GAMM|nr:YggT family protein [Legionella rubrilucens]KTD48585.1 YggT family protein [Legionella rubrilucens]
MTGLVTVGYYLVSLFFSLILLLLWARIFLRYFRISALHPISQGINGLLNPIIGPVERLVYRKQPAPKRYDWITLLFVIAVELIKFFLIGLIVYGAIMPFSYLLLFTAADLIVQPLNLLFFMVLIRALMSWINPQWHHPAGEVLAVMTNPLLALGRKIIPDISGFDFSPIIIMIMIKVITLFISASMPLPIL